MPPVPPQPVQLNCPQCQTAFRSHLSSLIEAHEQPDLKHALLTGQLNVAVCPTCNAATFIAAPLVYHDAEKHLCFVYIPQEMNLGTEEQEQIIGERTGIILQTLPPDHPRGYLLTPRRFMSLPSLIDAILDADGIPREVIEKQRHLVELISTLAEALDDDARLSRLVEQYRNDLNHEFFAALGAFIEASAQEQRDDSTQMLTYLREKLIQMTGLTDVDAPLSQGERHDLFERLKTSPEEELEAVVAEVRPHIDYQFFQSWTARIEALEQEGKTDEANHLTHRRSLILETVERMDRAAQTMLEESTRTLQAVLEAPDVSAALHERSEALNEAFLMVLAANIEAARQHGQEDFAARLEEVHRLTVEVIQSKLPPEERFINELLMTETSQESTRLLRQNTSLVTADFVRKLNELADEQEKRRNKELVSHLRRLAREASAMLF